VQTYLLKIQYYGFRYHGWMLQPNVKTVQGQLNKTIQFLYPNAKFKTLGCGRTDAMVSANESYVELFIDQEINTEDFHVGLSKNLPQDIHILEIVEVSSEFEVIGDVQQKEYHYLFTDQEMSPLCSGMMTRFREKLDFDVMQKGAAYFEGRHWFGNYCYKKQHLEQEQFFREIKSSNLLENDVYEANFFPERTYLYRIVGKGFMRHQVRMMVGALIKLGNGTWDWETFTTSLTVGSYSTEHKDFVPLIAPASGLILNKVQY
jgi:tRNA pseudouridine38-40 synthase